MQKVLIDKNYNLVRKDSKDNNVYSDEIDRKIDLVFAAIEKAQITKEEGIELLQILLSKELKDDVHFLTHSALHSRKRKKSFLFLLSHSSCTENYAS